jgi:two-component system response regulator (stage 0 sporulation protein F)
MRNNDRKEGLIIMGKKILIVDDDKQIAFLLASRLKANEYETVVAYDAVQAVAKAIRERPDLILLDIKMPGGGGLSVLDHLRNSAHTALTPVIIITAHWNLDILETAKQKGATGFISKPFKTEDLLPKIRKTLGEVSREREA